MRRSSRGNPYHDKRGRFTTGGGKDVAYVTQPKDYEQQTKERKTRVLAKTQTPLGEALYTGKTYVHISSGAHSIDVAKQNRDATMESIRNPYQVFYSSQKGYEDSRLVFFGALCGAKAPKKNKFLKVVAEKRNDGKLEIITVFSIDKIRGNIDFDKKVYEDKIWVKNNPKYAK